MIVKVKCHHCGKELERRADKRYKKSFCNSKCISEYRKGISESRMIFKKCFMCDNEIRLNFWQIKDVNCCSRACGNKFNSIRFTERNKELNSFLMTDEIKKKLRNARLGRGLGKSYEKTYGRHTHRVVMEKIIGRKLLPGEVVHHIDEDKRNNDPSNLMLFSSQAEHAAHHKALLKKNNNS